MVTPVMMTPVMKKGEEGGVEKIEPKQSKLPECKAHVSHQTKSKVSKIQAQPINGHHPCPLAS
jgi:hypothetical protein